MPNRPAARARLARSAVVSVARADSIPPRTLVTPPTYSLEFVASSPSGAAGRPEPVLATSAGAGSFGAAVVLFSSVVRWLVTLRPPCEGLLVRVLRWLAGVSVRV